VNQQRIIGIQIRDYKNESDIKRIIEALDISIAQIFIKNSSKTFLKNFFSQELYIHGSYLINLADESEHHPVLEKELLFLSRSGFTKYVLHPGSWNGYLNKSDALKRVAKTLQHAGQRYPDITFILENTPNANKLLGADISDFHYLMNIIEKNISLSFCIDTAHAFVAGYPLHTQNGLKDFTNLCRDFFGNMIALIHLNDTLDSCGSNKDQHEIPGRGILGYSFIKRFLENPLFKSIPIIIEPPALSLSDLRSMLVEMSQLFF